MHKWRFHCTYRKWNRHTQHTLSVDPDTKTVASGFMAMLYIDSLCPGKVEADIMVSIVSMEFLNEAH